MPRTKNEVTSIPLREEVLSRPPQIPRLDRDGREEFVQGGDSAAERKEM